MRRLRARFGSVLIMACALVHTIVGYSEGDSCSLGQTVCFSTNQILVCNSNKLFQLVLCPTNSKCAVFFGANERAVCATETALINDSAPGSRNSLNMRLGYGLSEYQKRNPSGFDDVYTGNGQTVGNRGVGNSNIGDGVIG